MGGLRINFDHMGFLNVHPMQGARAFSHFTPIEMQPPRPGFDAAPPGLAAQRQSHFATTVGANGHTFVRMGISLPLPGTWLSLDVNCLFLVSFPCPSNSCQTSKQMKPCSFVLLSNFRWMKTRFHTVKVLHTQTKTWKKGLHHRDFPCSIQNLLNMCGQFPFFYSRATVKAEQNTLISFISKFLLLRQFRLTWCNLFKKKVCPPKIIVNYLGCLSFLQCCTLDLCDTVFLTGKQQGHSFQEKFTGNQCPATPMSR